MTVADAAIGVQTRVFVPSARSGSPHDDEPDVPAAGELFCDEALERLRNREHDALGFCAGLLGQLGDAQERALGMFD